MIRKVKKESDRRSVWSVLFKVVVPLVITVGLCWRLFSDVDFSQMVEIIRRHCDYRWILLGMLLSVFSHVFRAMRWQIQLRAIDVRPGLFALTLSIFGTYAVNLVFPRLGELWRTGYIAQREDAPFDGVFGSMVADRLADTITVGLMTLATMIFAGGPLLEFLYEHGNRGLFESVRSLIFSPWPYICAVAVCVSVWWLMRRFAGNRFVARVRGFVAGLWHGFAVVASMRGRLRWLVLTVMIWGCYFLQLYVAFFAFPATAEVVAQHGAAAVMVCFVLSSISMVVPSNGGIGPWQTAVVFGLSLYASGIPELTREYSTAFANLVMGSQTLMLILLGIFTFVCIAIQRRRRGKRTKSISENV